MVFLAIINKFKNWHFLGVISFFFLLQVFLSFFKFYQAYHTYCSNDISCSVVRGKRVSSNAMFLQILF